MGVLKVKVNGQWVDVGVSSRGVTMNQVAMAANTVITGPAPVTLLTLNMPAQPTGTLLDISGVVYANQGAVGTQASIAQFLVNGVALSTVLVIGDRIQLESYSWRHIGAAPPANTPYVISMIANKSVAGGTLQAQATNTILSVVSHIP